MAKSGSGAKRTVPPVGTGGDVVMSAATYWGTALLLAVAAVLSAFLLAKHFGGSLPGCGPKSGCEALESTAWGTVPGIRWPVSFLGFSYFIALLAGWMIAGREFPRAARWILRLGGAASLLFVIVMVAYRKVCPYCVGTHAANLAVLVLVERALRIASPRPAAGAKSTPPGRVRKIAGVAGGAFLVVSLLLGLANVQTQKQRSVEAEQERQASTARILAQSGGSGRTGAAETTPGGAAARDDQGRSADGSQVAGSEAPGKAGVPSDQATGTNAAGSGEAGRTPKPAATDVARGGKGFTGRYRIGPEASPIRVVMLTDYQCPDCRRVEDEIFGILSSRKDVSLSVKQFPFCQEASPGVPCNQYVKTTLHANACWAARAAEAAGILKGNDGFWAMHRWLFARHGAFTDAELNAGLIELGFEPSKFIATMKGPETLRLVQADCEEGSELGLYFTPMIFVNGVEFRGWQTAGALARTITEVAATNPPALTAAADRPPTAGQKDVDDWRAQPLRSFPPDTRAWSTGATASTPPANGGRLVDVVLFGDYQEPYTAAMDRSIRDLLKPGTNIRYTFRHYPIDPASNPTIPAGVRREAIHPLAGRAAKAAEAAGSLGGPAGYWKMHAWLMDHVSSFNDDNLKAAAAQMGIDPARLMAEMDKPQVSAAIVEDARAAQQLGLNAVPMVFVNGRWIQRTLRDGQNVVLRVIDAAGRP